MDYVSVDEARSTPGLRLVLTAGVPGPWGEAAKGVLHVKKIPYTPIRQDGGQPNDALRAWTGHDNAPQAIWNSERARIGYAEIILLAERLEPSPPLVPRDARDRVLLFGLLHEIAGEQGFAWCRRLQICHGVLRLPEGALPAPLVESVARLAGKYGYSPEQAARADGRVVDILGLLSRTLLEQRERGSEFLVGDALSAADIYWAAFAAMLSPLPAEQCPMPEGMRNSYTLTDERALAAADPILLAHRDRIYRSFLELPLRF